MAGAVESSKAAFPRLAAIYAEPPTETLQAWQAFRLADNAAPYLSPHSPRQFRVNAPVRNMDKWYAAFEVRRTDELYLPPDQRVRIW